MLHCMAAAISYQIIKGQIQKITAGYDVLSTFLDEFFVRCIFKDHTNIWNGDHSHDDCLTCVLHGHSVSFINTKGLSVGQLCKCPIDVSLRSANRANRSVNSVFIL